MCFRSSLCRTFMSCYVEIIFALRRYEMSRNMLFYKKESNIALFAIISKQRISQKALMQIRKYLNMCIVNLRENRMGI